MGLKPLSRPTEDGISPVSPDSKPEKIPSPLPDQIPTIEPDGNPVRDPNRATPETPSPNANIPEVF